MLADSLGDNVAAHCNASNPIPSEVHSQYDSPVFAEYWCTRASSPRVASVGEKFPINHKNSAVWYPCYC